MSPPSIRISASNPELPADLTADTLAFWVQAAALLGFARSVGEIFGTIFLSAQPLTADDLVDRLGLSRSAAGQGIKTLLDIGAIRPAHQLSSRKDHFQIQPDLGVPVKALLHARVFPQIEELGRQRAALHATAEKLALPHLLHRFEKLDRWQRKASPVVTLLQTLIG